MWGYIVIKALDVSTSGIFVVPLSHLKFLKHNLEQLN